MDGAIPVPEGAIKVGEPCVNLIRSGQPLYKAKWDGTCVQRELIDSDETLRDTLISRNSGVLEVNERDRVTALSLEQVKAELGVV
jgi:hypothetical protein